MVDGRGRVREWAALREVGHWSNVLALHSATTPARPPGRGVAELVTGTDRVDLAAALAPSAGSTGARMVRVDSGGALIGALLDAGLVDELSLLVHPVLVGGSVPRWFGSAGEWPRRRSPCSTPLPDSRGTAWLPLPPLIGAVVDPAGDQRSNSAGEMPTALQASRTARFSSSSKLPSAPPMMIPTWITARAASGLLFSRPMVAMASTLPKS